MRALIQKVSRASVTVQGETIASIDRGFVVFLGLKADDKRADRDWLIKKILNVRLFEDTQGVMNHSLKEVGGDLLLVSQFTLYANPKKGNRPSYNRAAPPELALPMFNDFFEQILLKAPGACEKGEFGAMMSVDLSNEGPVTIWLDSQRKEN